MSRKPRLEIPGAIYHVINRGNCRLNVGQASSVSAFVSRVRNGEMNNEIKPSSTKLAD
jgi:hypothetical protein